MEKFYRDLARVLLFGMFLVVLVYFVILAGMR